MTDIILFSDEDQKKTLSTPEARSFLHDGVINPESDEWKKLPKDKQLAVLDECAKLSEATQKLCASLKAELDEPDEPEEPEEATKADDKGKTKKGERKGDIPADISEAAENAKDLVRKRFGSKEYISIVNMVLGQIPGYEVSSPNDARDILYASRDGAIDFITWLEEEGGKGTNTLDTDSKKAGRDSFVGERTKFDTVEEKRKHILEMLTALETALDDPKIQAGLIESGMNKVIKGTVITLGGTALILGVGGILVFVGGKWILRKALGTAGAAVVSAIGGALGSGTGLAKKGATEVVKRGLANRVVRGAIKGGAIGGAGGLAAEMVFPTGISTVAGTVGGGVIGGIRGARNTSSSSPGATPNPTPGAAPTATPGASPEASPVTRALDIANNKYDAGASEAILRNIYNTELAQARVPPIGPDIPLPGDWAKPDLLSISNPKAYATYMERIKKYLALGDKPTDPTKITKWQHDIGEVVRGERKPTVKPKVLGGTAGADDTRYRATSADRLAVGREIHRSAVTEARVLSYSIGGTSFEVSEPAEVKLRALQAIEEEHARDQRKLETLIAERATLETQRKALETRYREEVTIESNTTKLTRIEANIRLIKDPISGNGTLRDASKAKQLKIDELDTHRQTFARRGTIDENAYKNDSKTKSLTAEIDVLGETGELEKGKLGALQLEYTRLQTAQDSAIEQYRTKYRATPRTSMETAGKLKGVGTAGAHGDGIETKIAANERLQGGLITYMQNGERSAEALRVDLEATPNMKGKLNGVTVSDASLRTRIANAEIEVPSLKGITKKWAEIARDVMIKATKK